MVAVRGLALEYPRSGGAASDPGRVPAVSGIDWEFRTSAISAIVGPSGCGKTSMVQAIAGLLAPSAGKISIDGTAVSECGPIPRSFSMISASCPGGRSRATRNYRWFWHVSAGRNGADGSSPCCANSVLPSSAVSIRLGCLAA